MYVDEVYDHTILSKVICILSIYAYIEYVVILIIYIYNSGILVIY